MESAMLSLSSMASIANADGLMSIKMLKNVMDANTQAAAAMISDLASMPTAGVGDLGGLLDVRG
jgi:hypothetical protein